MEDIRVVRPETYASYERELEEHVREACIDVGYSPTQIESTIRRRLARVRGEAMADLLDERVGVAGKRVLDVGSGFGEFVLACLARGGQATGIEPDEARVRISHLLLESFGYPPLVRHASGEAIPFDDGAFDVVVSQHVLEHVNDRRQVVSEMIRVTRPGGHLLVSVPNYLFPYEGHYKMPWVPLMPKPIGRVLLRLRGRNPRFLTEHVHYTTYPGMMKLWRHHNLEVTNLTRERVMAGAHASRLYERPLFRVLALRFHLFPTVTWLLRKPIQEQ